MGANGNTMLEFIEEIHQQTGKMCRVGPSPDGFGVENKNPSAIGIYFDFNPCPIKDNTIFPQDVPGYEVSIRAFDKKTDQELSAEEVAALLDNGETATQTIAKAVIRLSKSPRHVITEDCWEAFDILAQQELGVLDKPEEPRQGINGPVLC